MDKNKLSNPVADPGFPIGGAPTCWGGANLRRVHFLVKTYAKMKEIDPVWGGHAPAAPPGSSNVIIWTLTGVRWVDPPCCEAPMAFQA